jgi:hypothetical protein
MSTVFVYVCVCVWERRNNWQFLTKIMVERQMSKTDFEARFISAYGDAYSSNRSQWLKETFTKLHTFRNSELRYTWSVISSRFRPLYLIGKRPSINCIWWPKCEAFPWQVMKTQRRDGMLSCHPFDVRPNWAAKLSVLRDVRIHPKKFLGTSVTGWLDPRATEWGQKD